MISDMVCSSVMCNYHSCGKKKKNKGLGMISSSTIKASAIFFALIQAVFYRNWLRNKGATAIFVVVHIMHQSVWFCRNQYIAQRCLQLRVTIANMSCPIKRYILMVFSVLAGLVAVAINKSMKSVDCLVYVGALKSPCVLRPRSNHGIGPYAFSILFLADGRGTRCGLLLLSVYML